MPATMRRSMSLTPDGPNETFPIWQDTAGGPFNAYRRYPARQVCKFCVAATVVSPAQWNSLGSAAWSSTSSWLGAVPDGLGAKANFLNSATAATTVTLDSSRTWGAELRQPLRLFARGAGSSTLTLAQSGTPYSGSAAIAVSARPARHRCAGRAGRQSRGDRQRHAHLRQLQQHHRDGASRSLTMDGAGGTLILAGRKLHRRHERGRRHGRHHHPHRPSRWDGLDHWRRRGVRLRSAGKCGGKRSRAAPLVVRPGGCGRPRTGNDRIAAGSALRRGGLSSTS